MSVLLSSAIHGTSEVLWLPVVTVIAGLACSDMSFIFSLMESGSLVTYE